MSDGFLLIYDAARQDARAKRGQATPAEVADSHGLAGAAKQILVSVIEDWESGNKQVFFQNMVAVYENSELPPVIRALAAEHASSCFTGDERRKWGMNALVLLPQLGSSDQVQITAAVIFGEWDQANRTIVPSDVEHGLRTLVQLGAGNAPGRVLWWVDTLKLQFDGRPGARQEARDWLQLVLDRAKTDHAMKEEHLQTCQALLDELSS